MDLYPTPLILRSARALAGVSQDELGKRAKVDPAVISRSETDANQIIATILRIQRALEELGVEFVSNIEIRRHGASLSDYLRAARAFTGLSQLELAVASGLDQKTVSRAEHGFNLKRETADALLRTLSDEGVHFQISGTSVITSVSRPASKKSV